VLAVGAAVAVGLGVVGAAPHVRPAPPAPAAEQEVVTPDVVVATDLVADRTSMAVTGTTRRTTRTSVAAATTVTAPASSRPVLRPGASGAAVTTLQQKLRVKASGFYGPMTLAAVVAFQKAHKLPAQGYVGPATWRALLAPVATKAVARARVTVAAARAAAPAPPATDGRVCPVDNPGFGDGWGVARHGHSHQGLDLVKGAGVPIFAVEDGVVVREGRQSNGALRIVLQGRSGSKFFYGHMSQDLVHAGSRVDRGQVIGLMGDSGSPGAVHLHFEYWKSGGESAAVNPSALLHSIC
jgi:murein DD-endopeptidase MepM/ murein hydrolase activator NlpD